MPTRWSCCDVVGSLPADLSQDRFGAVTLLASGRDFPTLDLLRWTHTLKPFPSLGRDESEMGRWFPLSFAQLDFRLFIPCCQGHLASVPCSLLLVPYHVEFSTSCHADGWEYP